MHRVRRREWYVCLCLCLCLCVWWWWWWWCESKRVTRLLYVSEVFFSCWCLWRVLCLCMTHPLTGRIEARALVDSELDGSEQQVSGWQFEWCALQAVLWVVVFLFYFIFVCTRSLFLSFFFSTQLNARLCVYSRYLWLLLYVFASAFDGINRQWKYTRHARFRVRVPTIIPLRVCANIACK